MSLQGSAFGVTAPKLGQRANFVVVLDVDSTLIQNEAIELLAHEAGVLAEVAQITSTAMHGEIDFETSLRARVAMLAGLDAVAVERARAKIRLTAGAIELIAGVHAAGGVIGVVSGGFHELLDPLATSIGLDFWRANRLAASDGVLTGELAGPVIDAQAKADALRDWAEAHGAGLEHTVAVGDGANDLKMMELATLSVAFCAKPVVRGQADVAIDTPDLAQVLPLLGLSLAAV